MCGALSAQRQTKRPVLEDDVDCDQLPGPAAMTSVCAAACPSARWHARRPIRPARSRRWPFTVVAVTPLTIAPYSECPQLHVKRLDRFFLQYFDGTPLTNGIVRPELPPTGSSKSLTKRCPLKAPAAQRLSGSMIRSDGANSFVAASQISGTNLAEIKNAYPIQPSPGGSLYSASLTCLPQAVP